MRLKYRIIPNMQYVLDLRDGVPLCLHGVNLVLIDAPVGICRPSVVADVKSHLLLDRVDAEEVEVLEEEEVRSHEARAPSDDPDDSDELGGEKVGVTVSSGPVVEPAEVRDSSVAGEVLDEGSGGEEAGGDASPDAVSAVDGDGIDGVVDLKLEKEVGGTNVDDATDETDDNRSPRPDGGGTSGDGDES